ncbi:hypothetical protein JTE90_025572 [Oedothorax gibbosus]|uniref:Transposase-associated domain-containing protein n=1 Tax=Oedothorax gibbosus TaxID=931172 RepID=A0AAV6TWJ5_9ARAC|nr:hypothetical protein JTE90_025572 [Oedothorax gibbosus]
MVLSRRHNVYKIVRCITFGSIDKCNNSVWHSLVKHNIYICSIDKGINSVWHSLVKSIYIKLGAHYKKHLEEGEEMVCPYENCQGIIS